MLASKNEKCVERERAEVAISSQYWKARRPSGFVPKLRRHLLPHRRQKKVLRLHPAHPEGEGQQCLCLRRHPPFQGLHRQAEDGQRPLASREAG